MILFLQKPKPKQQINTNLFLDVHPSSAKAVPLACTPPEASYCLSLLLAFAGRTFFPTAELGSASRGMLWALLELHPMRKGATIISSSTDRSISAPGSQISCKTSLSTMLPTPSHITSSSNRLGWKFQFFFFFKPVWNEISNNMIS